MKGVMRTLIVCVLLSHITAVVVIVVAAFIGQTAFVLPSLSAEWVGAKTAATWIDYFIPITLSGIILAFSVGVSNSEVRTRGGRSPFALIAGNSVGFIIFLSAVYIVVVAFAGGAANQVIDDIESHSKEVREVLANTEDLIKEKRVDEALARLNAVLPLANDEPFVIQERDRVAVLKQELTSKNIIDEEAQTNIGPSSGAGDDSIYTYAGLLERAEGALADEDYFSALHFTNRALDQLTRMGRTADPAIVSLRTRINEKLRGAESTTQDEIRKRLYEIKRTAIVDSLENGKPDEAYYLLKEAEELYLNLKPDGRQASSAPSGEYADPDVRKWMPEVEKALQEVVFFLEEIDVARSSRSSSNLLFINLQEEGKVEFIYARSMARGRFGFFMFEPEIIRVDSNRRILEHRYAPYGKIVGDLLLLRAIPREREGRGSDAQVLSGNIEQPVKNIVSLFVDPDLLWNLAESRLSYSSMSFPTLLYMSGIAGQLGFDILPLQAVILEYVIKALSLGSLAFLSLGWAWSMRSRYLTRPIPLMILMFAMVPLTTVVLFSIYLYAYQAIAAGALSLIGFEPALVGLLVLQGVQIGGSLFYVAGQSPA